MSSPVLPATFYVQEKTRSVYTAVIKDEDGLAIPSASILTLTLTLYNQIGEAIINSRNAQSVKNANGGTVDSSGNLTMVFSPTDNAHQGTAKSEIHVAVFRYTYDTDGAGSHTIWIQVTDEPKVT